MAEPALFDVDASPIAYRTAGDADAGSAAEPVGWAVAREARERSEPEREMAGLDAPSRTSPGGPLVVFLHGLGGGRSAWDPQLRAVGERRRVVAWDMPGYGASAPVAGRLDFAAITDALVGLLDRLAVDAAHLVGLSFGGMHAQHVALARPDRVLSLTLVDTSPAFGLDGTTREDWLASRLGAFDAESHSVADSASGGAAPARSLADIGEHVVRAIAAPGFAGPGFDESVAAFGRISVEAFRASCHCLVEHDLRGRLGAIVAPTLVVVGELDTETPPSYAATIAAEIPDARLVEVPGAGHLVPAEAPETVNRLLVGFLDEVEAR